MQKINSNLFWKKVAIKSPLKCLYCGIKPRNKYWTYYCGYACFEKYHELKIRERQMMFEENKKPSR